MSEVNKNHTGEYDSPRRHLEPKCAVLFPATPSSDNLTDTEDFIPEKKDVFDIPKGIKCGVNKANGKATLIKCLKEGCKSQCSLENFYCGKHQICVFVDATKLAGLKVCYGYLRGCREQLGLEQRSKCKICLSKDREKDHSKRANAKAQNSISDAEIKTQQICTTCCKDQPIDQFEGAKGQITKTCQCCREDNKKQNQRRDKEHTNEIARKNDKTPERLEVKKNGMMLITKKLQ